MRLFWLTLTAFTLLGCGSKSRQFNPDKTDDTSSLDSTNPDAGETTFCGRGCAIDGRCITAGATNPDNACEVCDPTQRTTDWTQKTGSCNEDTDSSADTNSTNPSSTNSTSPSSSGSSAPSNSTGGSDTSGESDAEVCVKAGDACWIDGSCVQQGGEAPGNPCLVCDPDAANDQYTIAEGTPCGGSDTCYEDGHCDSSGQCMATAREDGTACDDGLFCTSETTCRSGQCVGVANVQCGVGEVCSETAGACVCEDGCLINGKCVAAGTPKPDHECLVCNPSQRDDDYSANVGANCGAEATECSARDTCSESGNCESNHAEDGAECAGGECNAGECVLWENPFDCIAPSPPTVEPPTDNVYSWGEGSPYTGAAPKGGKILDGRYVPTRVELYNYSSGAYSLRTFEFKHGFVQVGHGPFGTNGAMYTPAVYFAGSYSTAGTEITFDVEACDSQYSVVVPTLGYTVSANGITMFEIREQGLTVVTQYRRE